MSRLTPEDFRQEVEKWAAEIGVTPGEVHLRKMTRKWGSCSTSGRLTFNSDLFDESEEVRTGAIVHELLHLKIPNHGPLFRNLERAYLADSHLDSATGETSQG